MSRITGFLLLLVFVGLLLINVACGGSGYESGDPKNQKAQEAAGVATEQPEETPTPVPEGATSTEPPAEIAEGN